MASNVEPGSVCMGVLEAVPVGRIGLGALGFGAGAILGSGIFR